MAISLNRKFKIITNNPMVQEKLKDTEEVDFRKVSYLEILTYVRDLIHEGYELKSHPLSGSVKPGETPYKSVLMGCDKGQLSMMSLEIIEKAIASYHKFQDNTALYEEDINRDFQTVDYSLIKNAVELANK